jgi:hypothetical protein
MQEEERRKGDVTPAKEDAEKDATSKETVSDLEESGASNESESGGTSKGSPSPDGQFDETRGGAGGHGNEAGPM